MNKFVLTGIFCIFFANHNQLLPGWSWKDFGKSIIHGYELPWFGYTVDISPQNGRPRENVLIESASYKTQLDNPNPNINDCLITPEGKIIPIIRMSLIDDCPAVDSATYRSNSPKHYIFFKRNRILVKNNQNIEAKISYTLFPLPIALSIGLITSFYFNQIIRTKLNNYFNYSSQNR